MAIVTNALVKAIFVTFSTAFSKGFSDVKPSWEKVATPVPSSSSSNTYAWLGKFPRMREWIGPRVINNLKVHAYNVPNKTFESTVGVDRDEIEDDQIGAYGVIFQEMGNQAATFPDELVYGLLKKGTTELCYDGQYFFDVDHPVYANNDGTGAVTNVTNFVDGVGGAGAGTPWYLLDCSRPLKPLILQERRKADFQALTKLDDERVFMEKTYRYGVDGRWAAGFGLWQLAYCSKQPLTAANFEAAYDAMRAVEADGGKPLGVKPSILVIPTSLRAQAEAIIKAATLATGASNLNYQRVEVLEVDWL